jgi:alpha-galactosidase
MLALTPPMGWNSWNTFGGRINEEIVRQTADAFVETGLKDAGYEYVVIDDTWEAPERDAEGRLAAHPEKFPSGIPALADYVHERGLKFGIYSCAGTHTCGVRPASFGHEWVDAHTFAEWGVDFLKYDCCYVPNGVEVQSLYRKMGVALRATGRPIVFSVCEWGMTHPWDWAGHAAGAHMWRTTGDITDNWDYMCELGFERQKNLERFAGPRQWNDPDMLIVGMRGEGNVAAGGCTDEQYRLHFTLWCMLAAPLMIGCDVRNMDEVTREILTAPEVVAVDQDPLGCQGHCLGHDGHKGQVWTRPLADGSVAVGFFNLNPAQERMLTVAWEAIGLDAHRPARVRDLWAREDLGEFTASFAAPVPSHACRLLRLTPLG